MQVSAEEFTPSAPVIGTGMGMGNAYDHARPRHRLVALTRHTPRVEDKSTPSGVTKLIAIRVTYTNWNPDSVCTAQCLQNNIWTGTYNVNGVYQEDSFGLLSIPQSQGLIVTVTLNVATTSYSSCNDLSSIGAAADAAVAAQFPSVSLSSYTNKLYLTGAICGIGVAYVGGSPGRAFINSAYADTIAHEIGHNYGMQHAQRDSGDDNVVDESYGDRSCIMGYSHLTLRGFNIAHRIDNGWIPSAAIMDLADGCTGVAQTITLSPLSHAHTSGAIVAVRTVRRRLGRYFVSFRNSDGYDGQLSSSYLNEVHIHYQITTGAETQLIAVLLAGQTWSQANGDLTVTVNSIASSGASISVKYCRPSSFVGVVGTLSCGSTVTGTNVGATNLQGYTSGDVLYAVKLDGTSTYTFSTCGSSMDTVLRVYTDGMMQQLSVCDNCGTCASNENNAVLSGFTGSGNFIIAVEGYNTAAGSFVLSMQCTGTTAVVASHSPTPSKSPAAVASHTPSPSKSPAVASHTPSPSKGASKSPSVTRSRAPSHSRSPSPTKNAATPTTCGSLITGQTCTSYSQCRSCTCSLGLCQ
jgi:hypothetical protein